MIHRIFRSVIRWFTSLCEESIHVLLCCSFNELFEHINEVCKLLFVSNLHSVVDLFHEGILDGDEEPVCPLRVDLASFRIKDEILSGQAQDQFLDQFHQNDTQPCRLGSFTFSKLPVLINDLLKLLLVRDEGVVNLKVWSSLALSSFTSLLQMLDVFLANLAS